MVEPAMLKRDREKDEKKMFVKIIIILEIFGLRHIAALKYGDQSAAYQ